MKFIKKMWNLLITTIQSIGLIILFGYKPAAIMISLYKMYLIEIKENTEFIEKLKK